MQNKEWKPTTPASGTVCNHVGLTVTDLDVSIAFYRHVVGLELKHRSEKSVGGDWFDTLTTNTGALIWSATLATGNFYLQLVRYDSAGRAPTTPHHASPGTAHLCFEVPDAAATRQRAVDAGSSPTPTVELAPIEGRSFYVDDPDGVPVEFIELGPESLETKPQEMDRAAHV